MSDATVTWPDLADDGAYERALGTLAAVTDALLDDVKTLDDDAVRRPSRCEGWTRAHVLTHLARNADALGNLLEWARTGVEKPAYAPGARDADIERGAGRTASELESDLDASSERFLAAVADLPVDRRHREVSLRPGVVRPAHEVLWWRIREVAYHHVDLATGRSFLLLPDWIVARGLDEAATRMTEAGAPGVTLDAHDTGQRLGVSGGGPAVTGTAGDLLAWITGRDDDPALESDRALPLLPSWG
ncbi:MAG TPA: maleylpyruvate isomerase family mycothiol-dependent enzyme [Actinomycetales bacterium]|nr:maleylpyruvate isomerase family mycothiol-dependent enzyme [Actinomycetales bacterium]